ncbi:MAG: hypothetical protein ACI4JY_07365 [Oscillospiraceae bacterium]
MRCTVLDGSSRLVISAGNTTYKIVLPRNTAECVKQINKCTEAALQAGNAFISVDIKDSKGSTNYTDKFLPWEYHHKYFYSKDKVNAYSLGVILFLFMFHRFPETAEQQLHRHIDYSSVVIEGVTDSFLLFANDYLKHSLCISSICRSNVSELHELTFRMLSSN